MSFVRKKGTPVFMFKGLEVPNATLFLKGQPSINKGNSINIPFELRSSNDRTADNLLNGNFLSINIYAKGFDGMRGTEVHTGPEGDRTIINAVYDKIPAAWGRGELPAGWPANCFAQGYFLGGLLEQLEEWENDEVQAQA